jgi:hypothetical protein
MKLFRLIIAVAIMVSSLGVTAAIGAAQPVPHPIPHQAPVTPQRALSEEWVGYIDRGNQRAACELQTVGEVNGQPCGSLPTRWALHCPFVPVGAKPTWSKSELRPVFEQVGIITEEGPDRAFAVLRGQKKGSPARGALGLELLGGQWRVSYLRQGAETYVPAGAVWMTETWRTLWYPPTCPR